MRVALRNVSHDCGSSDEPAAAHVLDVVSLGIPHGDLDALRGASRRGKSTLLHLIAAVARPTSGQNPRGDSETTSLDASRLTDLRRNSVGFLFQFSNLLPP